MIHSIFHCLLFAKKRETPKQVPYTQQKTKNTLELKIIYTSNSKNKRQGRSLQQKKKTKKRKNKSQFIYSKWKDEEEKHILICIQDEVKQDQRERKFKRNHGKRKYEQE